MIFNYIPGQESKHFDVYRNVQQIDKKGRVLDILNELKIGTIRAMLSTAKESEVTRWKQTGHTVSHTIVHFYCSFVEVGDVLILNDRKFYIHGKDNPGELNLSEIFYCEESYECLT